MMIQKRMNLDDDDYKPTEVESGAMSTSTPTSTTKPMKRSGSRSKPRQSQHQNPTTYKADSNDANQTQRTRSLKRVVSDETSSSLSSSSSSSLSCTVPYRDSDVLFGRGGLTNNHPGNQVYRRAIENSKGTYKALKTTADKRSMLNQIYTTLQDEHGVRFLTKGLPQQKEQKAKKTKKKTKRKENEGANTGKPVCSSSSSSFTTLGGGWYEVPKTKALGKIRQALTEARYQKKTRRKAVRGQSSTSSTRRSATGIKRVKPDRIKSIEAEATMVAEAQTVRSPGNNSGERSTARTDTSTDVGAGASVKRRRSSKVSTVVAPPNSPFQARATNTEGTTGFILPDPDTFLLEGDHRWNRESFTTRHDDEFDTAEETLPGDTGNNEKDLLDSFDLDLASSNALFGNVPKNDEGSHTMISDDDEDDDQEEVTGIRYNTEGVEEGDNNGKDNRSKADNYNHDGMDNEEMLLGQLEDCLWNNLPDLPLPVAL